VTVGTGGLPLIERTFGHDPVQGDLLVMGPSARGDPSACLVSSSV